MLCTSGSTGPDASLYQKTFQYLLNKMEVFAYLFCSYLFYYNYILKFFFPSYIFCFVLFCFVLFYFVFVLFLFRFFLSLIGHGLYSGFEFLSLFCFLKQLYVFCVIFRNPLYTIIRPYSPKYFSLWRFNFRIALYINLFYIDNSQVIRTPQGGLLSPKIKEKFSLREIPLILCPSL